MGSQDLLSPPRPSVITVCYLDLCKPQRQTPTCMSELTNELFFFSSLSLFYLSSIHHLFFPCLPPSLHLNLLTGGWAPASLTWKQALLIARGPRPLKRSSGRFHQRPRLALLMQMCSHTWIENLRDCDPWNIFFTQETHTQYVTQIPTHAT